MSASDSSDSSSDSSSSSSSSAGQGAKPLTKSSKRRRLDKQKQQQSKAPAAAALPSALDILDSVSGGPSFLQTYSDGFEVPVVVAKREAPSGPFLALLLSSLGEP